MENNGLKKTIEEIKKRNNTIEKTIDTLLDIRLTLTVKRLIDKTIDRLKFKEIVDNAKKTLDEKVKYEIDNTFNEYFGKNKSENNKSDNDPISFNEMKESYEQSFKDGENKGKTLTLNNGHFNNDSDLPKAA